MPDHDRTTKVDWRALEHAHGSAEDLPALFERVGAGQLAAVSELADCLTHQGWVSPEAAGAAVPTVAALIATTKGAVRARLITLLADVACLGSHEHFLGTRLDPATEIGALAAAPTAAALRSSVVSATASAAPGWLVDRSPRVRAAAALLMAVTGCDAAPLVGRLQREKHAQARADQLIAYGWLAPEQPDAGADAVLRDARSSADPAERAAAYIASGYRWLDDETVDGLREVIGSDLLVEESVWAGGRFGTFAAEVLRHRATLDDRTDVLFRAMAWGDAASAGIALALLQSLFSPAPARSGQAPTTFLAASLTDDQRRLLEALSAFDRGWTGELEDRLQKLGLPLCPPAIRRYLGHVPPPDLLDRGFASMGREQSVRSWIRELAEQERTERIPELIAFGRALGATWSPEEAAQATALSYQVDVRWARGQNLIVLHALMARGEGAAGALEAELEAHARAPMEWWTETCSRVSGDYLPLLYWIALKATRPDAALPPSVTLNPRCCEMMLNQAPAYGDETAARIVTALAPFVAPGA
ncbi:MAG: hypothetical protein KF894_19090 [Labilithrix sp.]|nr:hypothetical protein [Labilithrix sp.]